ncbi:helix-turn-helix transcriptional regulator [Algoriphagus formosus]|uniref:helix-turn-helix transcriptional regulator n=1 Tax=Algoriphagus formosus TaxID=2007308 RepID=UPI000C282767|nr:helix-turn-helix transcriptional regulator [Algoriphagus formosus]
MPNKSFINAMKHCVSGKLPAGITDKNVEFLAQGEEVFALMQSQLLPLGDWPQWLIDAIERDMEKHPKAVEALVEADIVGRMEMIGQYVKCRYSALDNEADVIDGQLQRPEFTDCNLRGSCPYEGRLCELLKAPFGTLTHREIEVLRLIPEGLLDKEIADQLGISSLTVGVYMKNLREKTGAKNKAELVRFAFQKNLL